MGFKYCNICSAEVFTTTNYRPLCNDCNDRRRDIKRLVEENKKSLTECDIEVYSALLMIRNKLTITFLAYKSNLSKQQTRKIVKKLVELGIVKKDKRLYYV